MIETVSARSPGKCREQTPGPNTQHQQAEQDEHRRDDAEGGRLCEPTLESRIDTAPGLAPTAAARYGPREPTHDDREQRSRGSEEPPEETRDVCCLRTAWIERGHP